MDATQNKQLPPLVLSYLALRKCIGIIGVALPIVLVFGKVILESFGMMKLESFAILDSISNYYYSVMRDVFVGSLCATGVFLFCYRYERWGWDDILGDVAGASAIGVALFPTKPDMATELQKTIGTVHLLLAGCFLLTLAIFALWLFRKGVPDPTDEKRLRNKVYAYCGSVIVLCLVLIVLDIFLPSPQWLQSLHPLFWLETLATWAFGIAWFVKGEGFPPLNDKKKDVETSKKVRPFQLDTLEGRAETL